MEDDESFFDFYADLRSDILRIMAQTNDVGSAYGTCTNNDVKILLRRMVSTYLHRVHVFGLYEVTLHHQCSNPNHAKVEEEYPLTNDFGLNIRHPHKGCQYQWHGFFDFMSYKKNFTFSKCPCDKENQAESRHTSAKLIIDTEVTNSFCVEVFISILDSISHAMDQCYSKRPRSSIREHLLLSVMQINDVLLPFKIDDFVERYRRGSDGSSKSKKYLRRSFWVPR